MRRRYNKDIAKDKKLTFANNKFRGYSEEGQILDIYKEILGETSGASRQITTDS